MVKIVDVNKKILEIYKASSKEDFIYRMSQQLKNLNDNNLTEPRFSENRKELISLIINNTIYESEYVSKTLTGDNIYLYVKTSVVPGFEDTWSKIIVSILDITDQKLIEQKLKESEEKYRTITDQSILGITIIQDNLIKYINHRGANLLGYTAEEILNWSTSEYAMSIHPDDRQLVVEQARKKQLNDPEVIDNYQFRCIKKTGEIIWVDNYSKTIEYEGSSADLSTAIDITEMKKAQQALEESEEKYYKLFETSPDGVVLADSQGRIIECNSAIENITGYPKSEFIGKSFVELNVHDEDASNTIKEGMKDLLDKGKFEFIDFPFNRKDGEVRWVQITGSLVTMKGKLHLLVVFHDISTTKNAEEALKISREKYRDLLETSSIGVLEIDAIKNKIKYINPKLLEIIGYELEELTDAEIQNKIIHPKDLAKLMETNEEMELEFRIIDKNGKLKWVSGKRIPHFDDNENLISTRLWLEDITEKKMYEELIYELNVNFLNFTADIQSNIKLLLNTGLKLLNGDLILYAHKENDSDQILFNIITSDNDSYVYNIKEFSEKLLLNEYFNEGHDFPQTFTNIDQGSYFNSDPFIRKLHAKGSFGKVIRSQEGLDNIVCVYYKKNPVINGQDKLVLFLICDAIEIEQRRWQVQQDLEEQNVTLNKINQLKTELLSRTSHELKTPLISIKGFTELLLTLHKSKLDPETISILDEIKEGSKRLEKIINLLLESAKLEAGQLEL
ncbi:MAG: PAS domain-containing sensor histidine kinase, partial [Candidatus Hodarchaeales archaeon]